MSDAPKTRVFALGHPDQAFRSLVETMNQGAAMVDAAGFIVYCNGRFAQLLNLASEDTVGRPLSAFIRDDERAACTDVLRTAITAPAHRETWLSVHGDGEIPVLLSFTPTVLDEKTVVWALATDLTATQENERIHASEVLMRSVLEQAAEAIVVCDRTGRITRVNEAAREMIGPAGLRSSVHAALPGFNFSQVLAGTTLRSVQGLVGDRAVLLNASPLLVDGGDVEGAVITLTDISDRLRYEQELARSNADLERFAFLASHDLQEPLRMVNAYAQLLTRRYREQGGPDIQVFADFIETGVRRMRQLLDDLLSYSRAVHLVDLVRADVDLNSIAEQASASLYTCLSDGRATLEIDSLPSVKGDKERLMRVFVHLIENAVKFAAPAPVRIRISAVRGDRMHTICVSDNGPGIPSPYRTQVLDLFKRLHGKAIPGSGIGLALCKRIIEVHGGSISVEEAEGGGTTVRFTLPAM